MEQKEIKFSISAVIGKTVLQHDHIALLDPDQMVNDIRGILHDISDTMAIKLYMIALGYGEEV